MHRSRRPRRGGRRRPPGPRRLRRRRRLDPCALAQPGRLRDRRRPPPRPSCRSRHERVRRRRQPVVFGLLDATGRRRSAATPDRTLSIGYHGPKGETIPPAPQTFIWAVEGVKGVYVGHATFPSAGSWVADFTSGGAGLAAGDASRSAFDVKQHTQVVFPGDPAPSVDTPTLADVGGDVAKISTDPKPDPALLPDVRGRRPRREEAVRARSSRRRSSARPRPAARRSTSSSRSRGPPGDDVHQRRAVPAEVRRAARSSRCSSADNQLIPVEATTAFKLPVRAVRLRRRRRRQGRARRSSSCSRPRRSRRRSRRSRPADPPRSTAPRPSASAGRVLEPDRTGARRTSGRRSPGPARG